MELTREKRSGMEDEHQQRTHSRVSLEDLVEGLLSGVVTDIVVDQAFVPFVSVHGHEL